MPAAETPRVKGIFPGVHEKSFPVDILTPDIVKFSKPARFVIVPFQVDRADFPQITFLNIPCSSNKYTVAAALSTDLAYCFVPAYRIDCPAGFFHGHCHRLLTEHIFTCIARSHKNRAVSVIGGGYHHRIDIFQFDQVVVP